VRGTIVMNDGQVDESNLGHGRFIPRTYRNKRKHY
jgi:hypothetical protein